MLRLINVVKDYPAGDMTVHALKGVSLEFRRSEFVAILGHSGCGKTTLLNIVGGLDQYTSGDLVINGKSTKNFTDSDWDSYRNHSVGFVFQSYNLITHQTVLQNVELALTLSGVSPSERRVRAKRALESVGLADQLNKKPNQLSGGQMQRVAIARALVNDPEILMADEPTGALDSETSVQIMDILREVARDRLVIMVTHNPELAADYATRIVRLSDGEIVSDSDPYSGEALPEDKTAQKKTGMSFFTALSLSLTNLMTKKGRTLLTAFAGSIGIIGIALIMSLSNGIQSYIDKVQEDTLSSYPIMIQEETTDYSGLLTTMMDMRSGESGEEHDLDAVYSNSVMVDLVNSYFTAETQHNNLRAFKEFLEDDSGPIKQHLSAVRYGYDLNLNVFTKDAGGNIVLSDANAIMRSAMSSRSGSGSGSGLASGAYSGTWGEMLAGQDGIISPILFEQYDLVYGAWPESYDEVVIVVNEKNEISDMTLYALGLKDSSEMGDLMRAIMDGEDVHIPTERYDYEEICGLEFKAILDAERYQYDSATGEWHDISGTDAGASLLYSSEGVGVKLRVSGIIRPNPDAVATMLSSTVAYTSALTDYIIQRTAQTEPVRLQTENPDTDVFTGLPFRTDDFFVSDEEKIADITEYVKTLPDAEKAEIFTAVMSTPDEDYLDAMVSSQLEAVSMDALREMMLGSYAGEMGIDEATLNEYFSQMDEETFMEMAREGLKARIAQEYADSAAEDLAGMSEAQLAALLDSTMADPIGFTAEQKVRMYDEYMPPVVSDASYDENMSRLGFVDLDAPSSISLYASTFADKDAISDCIAEYNRTAGEDNEISYTDYVALLMSSITTIIDAISYVLIAFVAISLVVSSIMIGIITYISVLERTKEIGILRAIGASKRDISNVFNAETLIIGFVSGALGIIITLLLSIPINLVIHALTDIQSLNAVLPVAGGVGLVLISMLLTFIAGLIPSGIAARKDPVVALRTE